MEKHDRLRLARERLFPTMKMAAESLGVPYGTYSGHEKGSRGFKADELALYARRLHVSRSWLLFGEGTMDDPFSEDESSHEAEVSQNPPNALVLHTPTTHDRTYIQVELQTLRAVLSGVLQNEGVLVEQADAYAGAAVELLRERSTSSVVLRLEDAVRTGAGSQALLPDDQS